MREDKQVLSPHNLKVKKGRIPVRTSTSGWHYLELASQVSEMKHDHYRQLLALSTLIELLVEKGILTPDEIRDRAEQMESELDRQLLL
jgi:hypothetical protein